MTNVIITGEGINQMQLQRNIFEKLHHVLCEVGVTEATVNVAVGQMLSDLAEYVMYPRSNEEREAIQASPRDKYQIGAINGINIFVDPMMQWSDTRVLAEGLVATIEVDPSMIV